MRTYDVVRTGTAPPLDGAVDGTPWADVPHLEIDQFNWHDGSGPRPATTVRCCYDDGALALQFQVEDRSISSRVTELNGPTFEDSSVELFADLGDGDRYVNVEANACGFFKVAWQENGWRERGIDRDLIPAALADEIAVETSEEGPTREPRPDDESWWLAARIPFATLAAFTGLDVAPGPGTEWRANLYRSGVATDAQKATWNPMPTPEPDYHSPEYFGRLVFR